MLLALIAQEHVYIEAGCTTEPRQTWNLNKHLIYCTCCQTKSRFSDSELADLQKPRVHRMEDITSGYNTRSFACLRALRARGSWMMLDESSQIISFDVSRKTLAVDIQNIYLITIDQNGQGPPGVAKTLLAETAAEACQVWRH